MSIIDDNGVRIIPRININPVEEHITTPDKSQAQDNNQTKKYENEFAGNFFRTKLDLRLTGDKLPAQSGNFISALFDDGSILKLSKYEQPVYQYDSKMSGKDAAKAVLSQENNTGGLSDPRDTQPRFYIDALKDHKNDPQWMAEFYKSLGPEKTAQLIDRTLTTSTFQYSKPENVRQALANIRESLSSIASTNPSLFEQKDMDALVKGFVKDSYGQGIYDLVAVEIFGKMDYKSESLKTMFFKSASQIALSGELGDRQSKALAAAAAHVLSQTSANNQAEQLSALRGKTPAGSISDLSKFITLAMHGPSGTPSLESRLGTLMQYPGEHGSAVSEPYGKVDSLIFNAAYSGYTDSFDHGPNLSSDQMKALRTELFQAATTNLTNGSVEEIYKNSAFLKDGLSEIYRQDFNTIYKSGLGENGSGLSSTLSKGLAEFFKFTVFTNSPGNLQTSLMNFVKTQVQSMAQALNNNDPGAEKAFQEKFGGLTRLDGAALLGNLLGTMKLGLNAHISEINENAEAKKEALGFLFDVTVGLIPGAGGKLTEGATNLAYKLLGQIADKAQDKIMDSIKTGALDKAKDYFLEANSNKNPMDLLDNLKEGVNMSLPDGDNGTGIYHQTFQSSYNYTLNN
ncbi:MAG: hypothetical protein ACR2GD_01140 [Pyrinomonadaceae bacterium]